MVIKYVDVHGQITRGEAANLCSLSPDQASRLLRRLAGGDGPLVADGEGRSRVYTRRA
ncbi:hypothetical protein [Frankia sp. Cj3]|nr:hypothetical protein [Frankia sp. Cj3]